MKAAVQPAVEESSARLFIALWPGAALRRALSAWRELHDGGAGMRLLPPGQLHLTLHFLGQVPRARIPALCSALRVPFQRHELRFSRCECWPGGLLVALPDKVPPALADLQAALGDALRRLGLATEARPFRPHVTLARRFRGPLPPALARPLSWPVRRCALVESGAAADGGYGVLCSHLATPVRPASDPAPHPA